MRCVGKDLSAGRGVCKLRSECSCINRFTFDAVVRSGWGQSEFPGGVARPDPTWSWSDLVRPTSQTGAVGPHNSVQNPPHLGRLQSRLRNKSSLPPNQPPASQKIHISSFCLVPQVSWLLTNTQTHSHEFCLLRKCVAVGLVVLAKAE